MALTTKQYLLLNNMIYSSSPSMSGDGRNPQTSYENRTLGDFVNSISPSGNESSTASRQEWQMVVNEVKSDPQLMNMKIVDTYRDASTGDTGCLLVDPSTNEAVITFRGTGGGEWKDNFIAGSTMNKGGDPTISPQQQKAVNYVNSLDLSSYDSVTVTGHSKGGNKAKTCALLCDEVDNCVSFDGQGFSDEFIKAHQNDIIQNQSKIQNHNVDGDFVNILLNDVGETHYYEGQRVGDNFAKNHDPTTFLNSNGEMVPGTQSKDMQALDAFFNSALRNADPSMKPEVLDFAGEIADAVFNPNNPNSIMDVITDPRYSDEASYLLAFTLQYERETGNITDVLSNVMKGCGKDINTLTNAINWLLSNDIAFAAVKGALKLGDDIPDWVINAFLKLTGLQLSTEEARNLLILVAKTGERLDDMRIDPGNGEDLTVSGSGAILQPDAIDDDIPDFDLSTDMLLVSLPRLYSACEALREAIEYYNMAIEGVSSAANALASVWEGDGKEAFVRDQNTAYRWYNSLKLVCMNAQEKMRQMHDSYERAQRWLANQM